MLNINKNITIEGESIIDGVKVAIFKAVINGVDPKNINIAMAQSNKEAYKEHRVAARADFAEFEDHVYSVQDDMLSTIN